MSDIFREVDEDIRQEKYRRLWDRFGLWIIVLAVVIVAGTGGYRGWSYWQQTKAREAGDMFLRAVALAESGQHLEAQELFGRLETATGGYPVLARLRGATDLAVAGNPEEAIARFDAIAADRSVDSLMRDLASLRAGYLALDSLDHAAVQDRLEGVAGDANPWRFAAREILAFSAWKAGDTAAARDWIDRIVDDAAAPADVSGRVGILNELIRAAEGAAGSAAGNEGASQ
ncbi:tetratricopeptide repeat protein [Polymorphum gilvum]|uniref:Ancillary SecYEG translocon subunit/Cell division coordinator CpoB TPR domain-containing protein n=1 Tax=Polymorphum gilvum (strain LMG 25793 / CGMCC 1.9160 / SL003B-26A1) TaxID=991905 RepID=F2J1P2_POLGS|nr:tetratricopeptide repeat protein [Polymorphum gilvum]ADZ70843.1 hypothetical protein SL003B_2418 [Polymorphum gilvum SL003B-26A1]